MNLAKNMGTADRTIRILIAIVIGVLYFTHVISGVLAIILGIVAIIFIVTSIFGVCPAYGPLGLSTRKGPPTNVSPGT
jgi:hypothetical protein